MRQAHEEPFIARTRTWIARETRLPVLGLKRLSPQAGGMMSHDFVLKLLLEGE
jgi:hypothetical protein